MEPKYNRFQKWSLEFSGCDGGDIGSKENKAVWICGIEWGGGHTPKSLLEHMSQDLSTPPKGYESWKENLSYIFNWQIIKLLSAINDGKVEDYKKFAEKERPFVKNSKGYFKMNLYPIGFKNTNNNRWKKEFSEITGFSSKEDYKNWCKEKRIPKLKEWALQYEPKLIICLGKTYLEDFKNAFLDNNSKIHKKTIEDKELFWAFNEANTLVVILPFMVNRYGLNKNTTIQKFGEEIKKILTKK
jgi:hypothetical protein